MGLLVFLKLEGHLPFIFYILYFLEPQICDSPFYTKNILNILFHYYFNIFFLVSNTWRP